ncbi:DUF2922 domain-containing protein [Aquibacillus koreensis]|uniref:DUF2922 domain-containing protein n=1 Tax=Aquibacillus koreensis TaxID=279446 RepID=A0A9X3WMB8_9BACI|nr:DUF2922 domain-containing protein [Aquibacillus koreensis]MCT2537063.1 DUF2922 domain-containing protein [Aquibacillus koreensis]MDC3419954.1 DUF2922 domain-containing protein [Aquibacillus koreensis]
MKTLEMKFGNEDNKVVTISLEQPIEPVDPVAVEQAMDVIIAQNVFASSGGNLVTKKSVRVVERNVEDIEI